ncbi:MAG: helix-turn-helix domain-containing protein [Chthoniobacterales bacterium]
MSTRQLPSDGSARAGDDCLSGRKSFPPGNNQRHCTCNAAFAYPSAPDFQTRIGVSPLRYLGRLRIQRAEELLEISTLSIKEISAEIGLNDVSHFVREFARTNGATPTEYRKQVREKTRRGD